MITDFYNETFTVHNKTESKVNGKLLRVWSTGEDYIGALFTPSIIRTVRWDKQDFVISKNLYCDVSVPINLGDRVTYSGQEFDVVDKDNTNAADHHFAIGLTSR